LSRSRATAGVLPQGPAAYPISLIGRGKPLERTDPGDIAFNAEDVIGSGDLVAGQMDQHQRRGFRVMRDMTETTDAFGHVRFLGGTLEYIDIIPSVLKQELNWTEVTRRQVLGYLRDKGLMKNHKEGEFTWPRLIDGRRQSVFRIKGEFFSRD
jgi:hypothetical protein